MALIVTDALKFRESENDQFRRLSLSANFNTPVPVSQGGTGADNAADARENLGLGNVANERQYSAENPPSISCVQLLDARNISSTEATSYACDWSNYDLLIICGMFYGNILETIVVPNAYFSTTNSVQRVQSNNVLSSKIYSVYRNGNNAVYILASQSETEAYGIRIYGVKIS